jgi:hypothetical protein
MNRNPPPTTRADAERALARALELSRDLLALADDGAPEEVSRLDALRLGLLKSVRHALMPMTESERAVLGEIADLNARSIGRMEHRFRGKCRDMDMLAAGRRAVRAYANTR